MKKMWMVLVFLLATLTPLALSGCGGACPRAAAAYITVSSFVDEANLRLGQVESILVAAGDKVPADVKAKISLAIQKAHDGLATALVKFREYRDACSGGADLPTIFREFNAAWTVIRGIIPLIVSIVGVSGSVVAVPDPAVYGYSSVK